MSKRVAIIGETGNGGYGHHFDQAFVSVAGAEIVALADPDEAGRENIWNSQEPPQAMPIIMKY